MTGIGVRQRKFGCCNAETFSMDRATLSQSSVQTARQAGRSSTESTAESIDGLANRGAVLSSEGQDLKTRGNLPPGTP